MNFLKSLLAFSVSALFVVGCATDTNPDIAANESVTELATSSVSGSIGETGGGGNGTGYMVRALEEMMAPPALTTTAVTACPTWTAASTGTGGTAATACSTTGQVTTFTYTNCSFTDKDGNYGAASWNGSKIFTFANGAGTPACGSFPSMPNGSTETITWGAGTTQTVTGSKGVASYTNTLTYDSTNASGFVSPQITPFGRTITYNGAGSHTFTDSFHLTATRSGTTKKGKTYGPVTAWDHTYTTTFPITVGTQSINVPSGSAAGVTVVKSPAGATTGTTTWTVNGTKALIHNLAKVVGVTTFTNVVWKFGQKHPCSGTIATTVYDKTGAQAWTESLSMTDCGTGTLTITGTTTLGSTSGKLNLQHAF